MTLSTLLLLAALASTTALAAPMATVADTTSLMPRPISWYPCVDADVASFSCTGRVEDCRSRKDWGDGRYGLWCPSTGRRGPGVVDPDGDEHYYEWRTTANNPDGELYTQASSLPIARCSMDAEGIVCDPIPANGDQSPMLVQQQ